MFCSKPIASSTASGVLRRRRSVARISSGRIVRGLGKHDQYILRASESTERRCCSSRVFASIVTCSRLLRSSRGRSGMIFLSHSLRFVASGFGVMRQAMPRNRAIARSSRLPDGSPPGGTSGDKPRPSAVRRGLRTCSVGSVVRARHVVRSPLLTCTAAASFRPMARRIVMAGHQFVNADCNRLSPTNTVSHSQ